MDVGLLILRLVVGMLFVGHGTQKLFGWFGGHGPEGTGSYLDSLGYRPGRPMAVLAGLSETGGGLLLALGFLTPLGAAAIIGMMTNAILAVHAKNGMWNTDGGSEFPLTLIAAATAVVFTGPGRYSIDRALGLDFSGVVYGIDAVVLGIAGALIIFGWRQMQLRRSTVVPEREEARKAA
jgi:putative oxidoreductase